MSVNQPIIPRTKTLANGAEYDLDRGRIISGKNITTKITSENAREMQSLSIARKRLVMAAAANREVQDVTLFEQFGDYAHVAERAITLQRIATTAEAGKAAVMAHDALTRDTGMSEKQAEQTASVTNNVLVLDDATRGMIAQLLGDGLTHGIDDVIEGGVVPPIDNYIDSSDALTPPLPHCDACLSCADSDTAQHAHDTAHSTHESRQAGTGRSEKKKRKVVGV